MKENSCDVTVGGATVVAHSEWQHWHSNRFNEKSVIGFYFVYFA